MGSAASMSLSHELAHDLSPHQKASVAKAVQEKYIDMHQQRGAGDKTSESFDAALFESLKTTYHEAVAKSARLPDAPAKSSPAETDFSDLAESKQLPLVFDDEMDKEIDKGIKAKKIKSSEDEIAASSREGESEREKNKETEKEKESEKESENETQSDKVVDNDVVRPLLSLSLSRLELSPNDDENDDRAEDESETKDRLTPLPSRRMSFTRFGSFSAIERERERDAQRERDAAVAALPVDERDRDPVRAAEIERQIVRERHAAVEDELERLFSEHSLAVCHGDSLSRGDSERESEIDSARESDDPEHSQRATHFSLSHSLLANLSTHAHNNNHPAVVDKTISEITHDNLTQQRVLRAKTSYELLSLVSDAALQDDQHKIQSFLSQLKNGEVATKFPSDFRQRRLTYEKEHSENVVVAAASERENALSVSQPLNLTTLPQNAHQEENVSLSVTQPLPERDNAVAQLRRLQETLPVGALSPSPSTASPAPFSRTHRPRTTIFASGEIGVTQKRTAPFPDDVLGTYSCHGIEPAPDEADGVLEKINQDRGCVVYPYNNSKTEALFMVLDGHGEQGNKVSEFVMRQIVVSLEKDSLLATEPISALKNAFITTNTALLVTDMNYMTSGTTCVAIYVRNNQLFVANCGDSRAIMAYTDRASGFLRAKELTRDHKPDDPDEQDRIQKWGGYVCPPHEEGLSARVYLDPQFTMIGLAMARSIGDHAVKNVGVIAEPEVKVFDLNADDKFLIIASDGVWEFVSNEEAVETVQEAIQGGMNKACESLIELAAGRWQEVEGDYRDDITAIVVKFPLPGFPPL